MDSNGPQGSGELLKRCQEEQQLVRLRKKIVGYCGLTLCVWVCLCVFVSVCRDYWPHKCIQMYWVRSVIRHYHYHWCLCCQYAKPLSKPRSNGSVKCKSKCDSWVRMVRSRWPWIKAAMRPPCLATVAWNLGPENSTRHFFRKKRDSLIIVHGESGESVMRLQFDTIQLWVNIPMRPQSLREGHCKLLRQEYHQKHGRLDIAKLSGVIAFDSATGVVRVARSSSKHVQACGNYCTSCLARYLARHSINCQLRGQPGAIGYRLIHPWYRWAVGLRWGASLDVLSI